MNAPVGEIPTGAFFEKRKGLTLLEEKAILLSID